MLFYFATFCKLVKYNYTIYTTLSGHVLLYVWNCKKLSNIITENWKLDTKQFTMSISRTECRNRYKDVEVNSFQLIPVEFVQFQPNRRKKVCNCSSRWTCISKYSFENVLSGAAIPVSSFILLMVIQLLSKIHY